MTTAVRTLRRATLEDLRAEIDAIDDSLHDLLMRRAGLAAEIARLKAVAAPVRESGVFFRPGREACVMRRILGRHRGPFPAAAVVRIWREVIGGILSLQGPLTVAAGSPALVDMVREHFGSSATVVPRRSAAAALAALGRKRATAALVRWPGARGDGRWWLTLARSNAPRVVAALPVIGDRPTALVLASTPPEASGNDRTLIAVRGGLNSRTLSRDLAAAGLDGAIVARGDGATLIDVGGFVTEDSSSISALRVALGVKSVMTIGAYARPISVRGSSMRGETA